MHIHSLYIYPIKSLPGISLDSSHVTPHGLLYDRIFLLERTDTTPPQVVMISKEPKMATFTTAFSGPNNVLVTHTPSSSSITIPLHPPASTLRPAAITMHQSPATGISELTTRAISTFFSAHLTYPTRLLYLGHGSRPILGSVVPAAPDASKTIGFSDCAPLMIASLPSLRAIPCEDADIPRFRPNLVLDGMPAAWEEDFWRVLQVEGAGEVELTANCVRCRSLDVDFKGGWEKGDERRLKRLMKDRRVDKGAKWQPVCGRYGGVRGGGGAVRVGGTVEVREKAEERCVLKWPGISTGD